MQRSSPRESESSASGGTARSARSPRGPRPLGQAVSDRQRLDEVQSIAHIGSWEWDPAADAVTFTAEGWRIWGLPEGSPPQSIAPLLARVHPEDRARLEGAARAAATAGTDYDVTTRVADGAGWKHLRHRGRATHWEGGRPVRLAGTVEDVTLKLAIERRLLESEERFRLAAQATRDVIWDWSIPDGALHVSGNLAAVFGHDAAILSSEAALELVHPRDRGRVAAALGQALEGDAAALALEYRLRHADGSYRHVVDRAVILRDAAGEPVRMVGAVQDVTPLRRAHRAQEDARRLREAAAFKTRLLAAAAHELGTPLTALRVSLAALRHRAGGRQPELEEGFGMLARNLDRLALLVQDLLDAARLQSGKLKVTMADADLRDVADHVAATFREQARQSGIRLEVAGAAAAPARCDAARIAQVLVNLVANALKFTPRGGLVRIDVANGADGPSLCVADTGAGLGRAQTARLFEPFSQVHDPAQRKVGGTGLGLYIAKGIVGQHGGRIRVDSEGKGKGSRFCVQLPARPAG